MKKIHQEIDEISFNFRGNVVHWFINLASLKLYENDIPKISSSILNGRTSLAVRSNIQNATEITKNISAFLRSNSDVIKCKNFDNMPAYLNKTAYLYLDALLQSFLDKITDLLNKNGKTSLTSESNGRSIFSKLDNLKNILPGNQFINVKHVLFIGQLRHIITHNLGEVDQKFIDNCKCNVSNSLIPCLSHLWDDNIWQDENAFDKDFQVRKQLSIPIDRVTVPYVNHAVNFIRDYSDASKKLFN